MQGTGWVIFWVVVWAVGNGLFIAWYRYARPHPRFNRTRHPADMQRSIGRFKTIVRWEHSITMKDCPACGGAGALLFHNRQKHVIPREHWEHAKWRWGNTVNCPGCHGLGYVSANWRPPRGFRWPQGAPVGT